MPRWPIRLTSYFLMASFPGAISFLGSVDSGPEGVSGADCPKAPGAINGASTAVRTHATSVRLKRCSCRREPNRLEGTRMAHLPKAGILHRVGLNDERKTIMAKAG